MPSGYKKDGSHSGKLFKPGHGLIGTGATGKRWQWTEEQKQKKKGKPSGSKGKHWKLSEETKMKMKLNHTRPMLGKKLSEETKKKISEAMRGERCYLWRGGISFEPYSLDWTRSLRISIRERDKYTCKVCGDKQGDRAFDIHHVDYDKKNCAPRNLVTLCLGCHRKTNHNRDYWLSFFKNI